MLPKPTYRIFPQDEAESSHIRVKGSSAIFRTSYHAHGWPAKLTVMTVSAVSYALCLVRDAVALRPVCAIRSDEHLNA